MTGTPQPGVGNLTDRHGLRGWKSSKAHLRVFKRETLVDSSDLGLNLDSMLLVTIVLLVVADKSGPGEGSKWSGSKGRSPDGIGSGLEKARADEGHG